MGIKKFLAKASNSAVRDMAGSFESEAETARYYKSIGMHKEAREIKKGIAERIQNTNLGDQFHTIGSYGGSTGYHNDKFMSKGEAKRLAKAALADDDGGFVGKLFGGGNGGRDR